MNWRFTLKHVLPVRALQFTNNEFELNINNWDQIIGGSDIAFAWNNPSSARSAGSQANTAAIGQDRPDDSSKNWKPGTYTVRIIATNSSTGGSGPFTQFLQIYGSDNGTALDDSLSFTGDSGLWDVGAGETTQEVTFTLTQEYRKIFFKFDKSGSDAGYNVVFTINSIKLVRVQDATDDHSINQPDGWKGAKIILEHDEQFGSLIEHYEGSAGGAFNFYGDNGEEDGGIAFIKYVEENYGFTSKIQFISEFAPDDVDYIDIFNGLLKISGKNEMKDNKMQVPVIRDEFWAKFINRLDTPVNISSTTDLYGNPVDPVVPITINLTDQYINQYFVGFLPEATYSFNSGIVGNGYIQIDFDDTHEFLSTSQKEQTIDEVKQHISGYPIIDNPEQPSPSFDFEFPGDVVVTNLTIIARNLVGDTVAHLDADIKGYIFDGVNEHLLTRTDYLGSDGITRRSRFVYSGTISDVKSIAVYLKNDSGSTSDDVGLLFDDQVEIGVPATYTTKFDFYLKSKYADTQAEGYLIHDLIHGVLVRLGLGSNPLYSEFLGATFTNSRQYDEDGCGCMYAILKGFQIRGYTLEEKPFFISFKQIWDGIDPILNLGLGYEATEDSPDSQYIRIEQADHFLDDDVSINFSNVREISSSYDQDRIFKSIKVGYKKGQSEKTSGNDDLFRQVRSTQMEDDGKELIIESDFIGVGLAFENTRRTKREKTSDYKYDNDNFILALNISDVSPDFYPELDENFDSVTGILNSDRRYNLILSPLRNFLRWTNFIGGCLQDFTDSSYVFSSGEGNYDMVSDYSCSSGQVCQAIICDSLSESQDIDLTTYNSTFGYHHLPLIYDIIIPMEWEEYETIRNNRKKAIGISQTNSGHIPFKIKLLEYDIVKGQAAIKAWPKTFLSITVTEQEFSMVQCAASVAESFDEDYQAILDYATSQGYILPSSEQQILQNQFVLDLKSADIWNDLDLLYVFATDGNEDFAKINWKNPGTFNCTEVGAGALTFTSDIGFTGDLTNYLNTGWDVANNAVNFTQNEGGFFLYCNNEKSNTLQVDVGARRGSTTDNIRLLIENAIGNSSAGVRGSADSFGSPGSSIGLFHAQRTASNAQRLFKNGTQQGSDGSTASSGTASSNDLFILADNSNGSPADQSSAQVGLFGIGASLTGKESTLYTAWNTYFSSL